MGKRILSLFLAVVMVFTMLFTLLPVTAYADEPIPGGTTDFAGGDGTEYDPYLIETAEQLNNVRNFLGEAYRYTYFKLIAPIDLSSYPNWEPIGNEDNPFYGRFYGVTGNPLVYHPITNLTINRPDESYVGLFGCCGDAIFTGVTIEGANVTGGPKTGILAGAMGHKITHDPIRYLTGKIDRCSSTGSVRSSTQPVANGCVGGLVGELINSTFNYSNRTIMINSYSTASVTGTGSVGGLAGYVADGGEVQDCYSAGSVTGSHYTGGVAGYVDGGGTVQDCYATGSVTGARSVGGVVGFVNTNGVVRRCAARNSSVSGTYDVGGVAGTVEEGTVEHCYAACSVTGSYYVGGVVGYAFNFDYLLCCYATGSVTGQYSVGGVVGSVEYVTVLCCAALNPSVSGSSNVGRVAGSGYNATFERNYAFSGVTVTVDGTVTPITDGAADNISGANKTAAEIKAGGISGLFTEYFTTENGKLPGFGAAVDMPAHIVDTITIITTSLPGGTVGIAYSQTLAATGDTPITWSIVSGDLPGGLSLSGNTISGTPGAAGTFDFTIKAENAEGDDTKAFEIVIGSTPPVGTAPVITTTSLPDGTVGIAYSQTLAATGDTPITWTIDSGSLPNGLSLSGNTISGTPTMAGAFDFTVKAENAEGSDTMALEIVIGSTPPVGTAPAITTTSLPDGREGSSYSRSLSAAGDTPITWTIDGGSLPNGLTLGGSTGVISGTPTARGNFSFTVKATNAVGSVTKELSITINAASTGGGSGGGSSDSGTTVIIQPEKKPDQPVMAGFSATPAVNSSGHATVTVSQKSVADAIAKAQADAKAQGKSANGIGISLNIDLPDTAKSLEIVLPQATLKSLVDAGVKQLEINGVIVSLDLDLEAFKEIQKQSTGDVTITLKPVQNLSASATKLIGARPVYDMTISYVKDGKTVNITSLGKGSATLSLPYTPNKNEAAGYLFGVYVDGKGNATRIPGSAYDSGSGSIILGTDHFSIYGVGYTSPSEKYTDIATHWASESIDYAVGRGLFSGTTEKTFSPNMAMDRGMLVTVLGRLAGADVSAYKTSSFTDVATGTYYLPYVEWAYKKGIVQDIGSGKFDPERAVTREEIAVILINYAKATGYTLPVTREAVTFADSSAISSIYRDAVKSMQQAGIMMGGSGNKFNPKASATRAEVATMLHHYAKLTIDPATAQGWAKNDDGRYMYYKDGNPLTGWQTIDGTRYFFHTNGTLQTGWVKDGDNWRFYSSTKALIGWWDIGSETHKKHYYFDVNAVMVFGKWLQIDGKWYYFYTDGSLAVSTKIGEYEVDENGVRKTK